MFEIISYIGKIGCIDVGDWCWIRFRLEIHLRYWQHNDSVTNLKLSPSLCRQYAISSLNMKFDKSVIRYTATRSPNNFYGYCSFRNSDRFFVVKHYPREKILNWIHAKNLSLHTIIILFIVEHKVIDCIWYPIRIEWYRGVSTTNIRLSASNSEWNDTDQPDNWMVFLSRFNWILKNQWTPWVPLIRFVYRLPKTRIIYR